MTSLTDNSLQFKTMASAAEHASKAKPIEPRDAAQSFAAAAAALTPQQKVQIIKEPLTFVQAMFAQHVTSAGNQPLSKTLNSSHDMGVSAVLEKLVQDKAFLAQVPSLNSVAPELIPCNALVRFRCVVQDVFDPEYYLGAFFTATEEKQTTRTLRTMKYRDGFDLPHGSHMEDLPGPQVLWERLPVFGVGVPGESEWAKQSLSPEHKIAAAPRAVQTKRRGREEDDAVSDVKESDPVAPSSATASAQRIGEEEKIAVEDNDDDDEEDSAMEPKRRRDQDSAAPSKATSAYSIDHLPPSQVQSVIKLYDGFTKVLVGGTYEFVGVIIKESVDTSDADDRFFSPKELEARHPAQSVASTIHAIHATPVDARHMLAPARGTPLYAAGLNSCRTIVSTVRSSLLEYITGIFGGDAVVAEVFLAFLMSNGSVRNHDLPTNKLNIEISGVPAKTGPTTFSSVLNSFLQMISPKSVALDVSNEALNQRRLHPVKDIAANRVRQSPLQLSAGTYLILDDTKHPQQQLQEMGLVNSSVLQQLVQMQRLEYDFVVSRMQYDVDIPVVYLSARKSSKLRTECHLKLQASKPLPTQLPDVPAELLTQWRQYLFVARQISCKVNANASQLVQLEMNAMRQRKEHVTQESLHVRVILARLLAASCLEDTLSEARWRQMQLLSARIVTEQSAASLSGITPSEQTPKQ